MIGKAISHNALDLCIIRKAAAMLFALWVVLIVPAFADGKMFASMTVPPDIPFQQAIICHNGTSETLVIQSSFERKAVTSETQHLGWVIPCPANPELDSMDSREGRVGFFILQRYSRPKHLPIIAGFSFLLFLGGALSIIASILFRPFLRRAFRSSLFDYGCVAVIVGMLLLMAVPNLLEAGGEVRLLQAKDIGIYHAQVIRSDSSAAILSWLRERNFAFDEKDQAVFDNYINQGWCFVVAEVRPGEKEKLLEPVARGKADPIIMRFQTDRPVYPLALTSTIGTNTYVRIYTLASGKLDCDQRLPLIFADQIADDWDLLSEDNFQEWERNLNYLCRFEGEMTTEQMRDDLYFQPAENNKPYHKRKYGL
ncbi:MAG: DUF2330 domain-containing protein [Candidatus Sumerlaeia bacterium]